MKLKYLLIFADWIYGGHVFPGLSPKISIYYTKLDFTTTDVFNR